VIVRVEVNREACICSERCVDLAPSTFEIDEHFKARLLPTPGDPEDVVRMAIDECPAQALHIASG
jgi:ferredoxin